MPGRMAPLKKPRNTPRLPLALNPLKSKDVLAVLAERNHAVVPIGAWVEPASPDSSEMPAYTSACVIEEELKEQLRRKQEALKHFQTQVKHRVNQRVRLRKKQQLQRSYEAAEKKGSIAMQSSDPAHLTPRRRTSVFPNSLNAAVGSSRLPPSPEDEENQNELFQQQAQALSQTMKQVRHQLASFKTMGKKKATVFPDGKRKSVPTQEKALSRKPASIRINIETREGFPLKVHQSLSATVHYHNFMQSEKLDSGESSSIMTDEKWRKNLLWRDQQDLLSEIKNKPFNRVQKVQFKNPLFDVMEEEELKQLHLQDILPRAQDYLPEAQSDLSETQGDLPGIHSVEPEAQNVELDTQAIELEVQAREPEAQASEPESQPCEPESQPCEPGSQPCEPESQPCEPEAQAGEPEAQAGEPETQAGETETQGGTLEAHSIEPEDGSIVLEALDFLPQNQGFLPKDQDFLPKDQNFLSKEEDFLLRDQSVLLKDQSSLPKDQNILPKCQDQNFLPKDQEIYFRQPSPALTAERWKKKWPTSAQQCLSSMFQGQPSTRDQLDQLEERDEQEKANLKQSASILIGRGEREMFPLDVHQDLLHRRQDQASIRYKKVRFKEPYSDMTDERRREDFALAGYRHLPPKLQAQTCVRDPVEQDKKEGKKQEINSMQLNMSVKQPSSFLREERVRQELPQENRQYVAPKIQERASLREQVSDAYQPGLNPEFQAPLALQSGVDQEEDKKVRQKQYLRYKRLFMDMEREQVKEQQRQKEHKKKIEKIKKKKEQERYAEEQRILRMTCHEEPYSGENMSEILAQLQLEEIKGEREKQKQREKEYLRYVEALRVQIQDKMQLYNITLPPLCCCGPDFWDAHPDTCANNCIFYKNPRAYTRALHSVISSCDIPEGNSALRIAIRNFASLHRRTLKNL
ncbi:coiled-coil domain-containing protein 15 isoform 1-T1 [Trichechus inunguis]